MSMYPTITAALAEQHRRDMIADAGTHRTVRAARVSRPVPSPRTTGTRVRRLAAVLAAVACGLVASVAAVPAAFARPIPAGDQSGTAPVPAATIRVIAVGGMPGWQITLIAVGAALLAAAAAVLLDRALAARRSASATTS
jgi:hypothetical protein